MRLISPLRAFPRLLALAALVALSTACLQAETAIQVTDDGSGTISLTEAVDTVAFKDFMKDFGELGGGSSSSSMFDPQDVDASKLPEGTKVEAYKSGNFEGVKLTAKFDKPQDALTVLNKLTAALSDESSSLTGMAGSSSASSSPSSFESLTIAKQGDGWKFDAKLAASGASGSADMDAFTKELMESILKDASVTLKLKLPGRIVESNADSTSNGEMTWKLPLTSDAPKTLSARTSK